MCHDEGLELLESRIASNERLCREIYLAQFEAPEIAQVVQPGQFVHIGIPGMEAHILRRPFSVYSTDADAGTIDILYRVVGFGSEQLSTLPPGAFCSVLGPIGRGWKIPDGARRILLVGGGLGAAPLFILARTAIENDVEVEVVLGATSRDMHVCVSRYEELLGRSPICSTDDGTFGYPGFATRPVEALLIGAECSDGPALDCGGFDYVAVCGPFPLMRAVALLAAKAGVPCEVSLERKMACGIGACLSCAVDTLHGKRRACVDGPVFSAEDVVW